MNIVIPMAGEGKRFLDAGYTTLKPLIPVDGTPMVLRSTAALPPGNRLVFVCAPDHLVSYPIERTLCATYPQADIVASPVATTGQAPACMIGIQEAQLPLNESLLVSNCDLDMVYDRAACQRVLDTEPDVVIWTFRHTPCSRDKPTAYGWIDIDEQGRVKRISPKVPLSSDPWNDHAETGAFWFKSAGLFMDGVAAMYRNETKTNNEYYVANVLAELLAAGVNARVFEVERFICWGTPEDLDEYDYWQGYFERRER